VLCITEKGVIKYGSKEEKLIYDNDSSFNQLSLHEEKKILPLKEFIIRKYFDEKAKIRTESEEANQSQTSLGLKYPEHAVVEVSDKNYSLGFKNPERAVVEVSDKNSSLGLKSPEHAVVDLSDNNEINNMSESIPNQRMNLENEIINIINKEHSKINMQIPIRTDIRGEINTENDRAIYSKQYPYALSASDFVNSEVNRMLKEGIIRPSKSPYNSPVLVVPKRGFNEGGTAKLRLVIDYKKLNENTIPERYPMQDPSVILSNLGKAKYFSTIDLESGFHQILMKETDIKKSSYSITNGKYEFLRMPFGLTNAPRIFQRMPKMVQARLFLTKY